MLRRLFFSIVWAACFLSVSFYLAFLVIAILRNEKFFLNGGGTFGEIVLVLLLGSPVLGATFVFLFGMRGRLPGTRPKSQPRK
jgi:hypothetical protein